MQKNATQFIERLDDLELSCRFLALRQTLFEKLLCTNRISRDTRALAGKSRATDLASKRSLSSMVKGRFAGNTEVCPMSLSEPEFSDVCGNANSQFRLSLKSP